MNEYSEECLNTFLKEQKKLFDEPVAENMEEAEAFLADCQVLLYEYKAAKRKGRSYFTAAFSTASETASNISCDVYGVSSDRVIESGDCVS